MRVRYGVIEELRLILTFCSCIQVKMEELVIVDTTATPALYIVGQLYSWSLSRLCSSLQYTDS